MMQISPFRDKNDWAVRGMDFRWRRYHVIGEGRSLGRSTRFSLRDGVGLSLGGGRMADKNDENRFGKEGKDAIIRRLRRVEGQIRGIIRMLEEDYPCNEVLLQVAAARSAIDKVGLHLIATRLKECMATGPEEGGSWEEAVSEAIETFLRFGYATR